MQGWTWTAQLKRRRNSFACVGWQISPLINGTCPRLQTKGKKKKKNSIVFFFFVFFNRAWIGIQHSHGSEWELVRESVRKTFLKKACLSNYWHAIARACACRQTDAHTLYLFFPQEEVTYPARYTQAYTLAHTKQCTSLIWCSDYDDSISSLCDWGDGGTDRMGVVIWCDWQEAETEKGFIFLFSRGGDGVTTEFIACSLSLYRPVSLSHLLFLTIICLFLMPASLFQPFCLFVLSVPLSPISFFFFFSFPATSRMLGGWISSFHPRGSHCIQENNVRPINRV